MQIASNRCPNCGAQIEIRAGAAHAQCEYCGHAYSVQNNPSAPPAAASYRESGSGSHQSCPACAEVIVAGAKKCKHCGEWLERPPAHPLGPRRGGPGPRPHRPPHAMQFMGGPGQPPMHPSTGLQSRLVMGLLALFFPIGLHRMLMGYPILGAMQFVTCFFGIGIFWCWADALLIFSGGVRMGDGRPLT